MTAFNDPRYRAKHQNWFELWPRVKDYCENAGHVRVVQLAYDIPRVLDEADRLLRIKYPNPALHSRNGEWSARRG